MSTFDFAPSLSHLGTSENDHMWKPDKPAFVVDRPKFIIDTGMQKSVANAFEYPEQERLECTQIWQTVERDRVRRVADSVKMLAERHAPKPTYEPLLGRIEPYPPFAGQPLHGFNAAAPVHSPLGIASAFGQMNNPCFKPPHSINGAPLWTFGF